MAVVASFWLAASLSIQFNLEVIMSTNMAMMAHFDITALCLVEGAGFLGSLASIPKRGETDGHAWLFRTKSKPTGGSIPPLPSIFNKKQ